VAVIEFERLLVHLVHFPEPADPVTKCGLSLDSDDVITTLGGDLATCAICFENCFDEVVTLPERRRAPRGPEGVRVVMADGAEVPVEVAYSHTANGMRMHYVTTEIDVAAVRSILIDVLPSNTAVTFGRDGVALRVLGDG